MPREDALFSTERGVSGPLGLLVSHFANSGIQPNGQRDDPRLIRCKRRRFEQVRFFGSQAQDAMPSALTAIVLEAPDQFAGPRASASAFLVRASCWELGGPNACGVGSDYLETGAADSSSPP
jgi:hypothetical protein